MRGCTFAAFPKKKQLFGRSRIFDALPRLPFARVTELSFYPWKEGSPEGIGAAEKRREELKVATPTPTINSLFTSIKIRLFLFLFFQNLEARAAETIRENICRAPSHPSPQSPCRRSVCLTGSWQNKNYLGPPFVVYCSGSHHRSVPSPPHLSAGSFFLFSRPSLTPSSSFSSSSSFSFSSPHMIDDCEDPHNFLPLPNFPHRTAGAEGEQRGKRKLLRAKRDLISSPPPPITNLLALWHSR